MSAWLRRRYGAGPLHLLSLLTALAFAGYLVHEILQVYLPLRILIWFAGAAIAHDLILWPLYAVADRSAVALSRRRPDRLPAVPWINHLRVPVLFSALWLAVSLPLVARWSQPTYHLASGLSEDPYLGRWLLLSGSAFALSAVLYAVRVARARRRPGTNPAG